MFTLVMLDALRIWTSVAPIEFTLTAAEFRHARSRYAQKTETADSLSKELLFEVQR